MRAMTSSPGTQSIDRAAQLLVQVVENSEPTSVGVTRRDHRSAEEHDLPPRAARSSGRGSFSATVRAGASAQALCCFDSLGATRGRPRRRSRTTRCGVSLRRPGRRSTSPSPGRSASSRSRRRTAAHFLGGTNWVGRRVPYHCSANGKVLLAFGAARLPDEDLERLTPQTIVDRRELERRARARAHARLRDRGRRARAGLSARRRARVRPRRRRVAALSDLRADDPHALPRASRSSRALLVHHAAELVGAARPRPPRSETRCRMTHDEILRGLYEDTLVGNAPAVKELDRAGPRGRAWSPR